MLMEDLETGELFEVAEYDEDDYESEGVGELGFAFVPLAMAIANIAATVAPMIPELLKALPKKQRT